MLKSEMGGSIVSLKVRTMISLYFRSVERGPHRRSIVAASTTNRDQQGPSVMHRNPSRGGLFGSGEVESSIVLLASFGRF